jgi:glycosyltransferase involved in cell wall biosynthesis
VQAKTARPSMALQVIGSGPMVEPVQAVFGTDWLGFMPLSDIVDRMRRAAFLVLPSICYENFPRTIVEAFACGLPVIASRIGSLAALVKEGETGLLFNPADPHDLICKVEWAQSHPQEMARMGRNARSQYEREFNAEVNFDRLMAIYQEAMAEP